MAVNFPQVYVRQFTNTRKGLQRKGRNFLKNSVKLSFLVSKKKLDKTETINDKVFYNRAQPYVLPRTKMRLRHCIKRVT